MTEAEEDPALEFWELNESEGRWFVAFCRAFAVGSAVRFEASFPYGMSSSSSLADVVMKLDLRCPGTPIAAPRRYTRSGSEFRSLSELKACFLFSRDPGELEAAVVRLNFGSDPA